jgi:hypothetical protein
VRKARAGVLAVAVAFTEMAGAATQTTSDLKTLKIVVGFSPGGGYATLVATSRDSRPSSSRTCREPQGSKPSNIWTRARRKTAVSSPRLIRA